MKDIYSWEKKFEACIYSNKLLDKVSRLNKETENKINITEVKKAIYYAKKYHGNQKRQSGEPYFSHPIEVTVMVADHCFKTDTLVTSILHDTIEDTALTKKLISRIFNPIVAEQVDALTRIKLDHNKVKYKIHSADTIELLWIHKKEDLLLIKLCDRLHNIQTISAKSPEKAYKIIKETFKSFISLSLYLKAKIPNLYNIHETIIHLCYQYLSINEVQPSNLINDFGYDFHLPFLTFQNEKDHI
jgi:(p)ppGpp synthase/HD superfamily hydrolase